MELACVVIGIHDSVCTPLRRPEIEKRFSIERSIFEPNGICGAAEQVGYTGHFMA